MGSETKSPTVGKQKGNNRAPLEDPISLEDAAEALARSGYLLECRVDRVLRTAGWDVELNSAFHDRRTGKSREFDVLAYNMHGLETERDDTLVCVLVCECVNNPQPFVCIALDGKPTASYAFEARVSGVPVQYPTAATEAALAAGTQEVSFRPITAVLSLHRFHHYCKGTIATQYCSFARKKNGTQWMAYHEDAQFDTIQTLCAATDFVQKRDISGWSMVDRQAPIALIFYFPVLVLQGDLLEAKTLDDGEVTLTEAGHLQLRHSSASAEGISVHQIDVVQEKALPSFLETLSSEMVSVARQLAKKEGVVRQAIEAISVALETATPDQRLGLLTTMPGV